MSYAARVRGSTRGAPDWADTVFMRDVREDIIRWKKIGWDTDALRDMVNIKHKGLHPLKVEKLIATTKVPKETT